MSTSDSYLWKTDDSNSSHKKISLEKTLEIAVIFLLGLSQIFILTKQMEVTKIQIASNSSHLVDSIESEMIGLAAPYFAKLTNKNQDYDDALRVVTSISEFMSNKYDRTGLAEITSSLIHSNKDVPSGYKLRVGEATERHYNESSKENSQTYKWHLVVGSFDLSKLENAKLFKSKIKETVKNQNLSHPVNIYKTKVSDQYAVTVGGVLDISSAMNLNSEFTFVSDQFVQKDKNWVLVN